MTKVVVCRLWKNTEISAFVDSEGVGAHVKLEDFLTQVIERVGNPTLLVTKAQLKERMLAASVDMLEEMKRTTVHVA